jgi:hypothetical protein
MSLPTKNQSHGPIAKWAFSTSVTKIIQDNAKAMKFMGVTIRYCNKYPI